MSIIFKPKRASEAELKTSTKILSKDEILLVYDQDGKSKLYRGDGVTQAKDLPVAIDGKKADDYIVSDFEIITDENPALSAGDAVKELIGKISKKFSYLESSKIDKTDGDISSTKITTVDTIADEFPVPTAGDTAKRFAGKMKKFCSDFNNFKTGVITLGKLVNNGTTTEEGFALDARYGKTLLDMVNQLNLDLSSKFFSAAAEINAAYGTSLTATSPIASVMAALKRGDRLEGYYVEQASDNNYPETFCRITGAKFPGAHLTCQAYSSNKNRLYYARVTDNGATEWKTAVSNTDFNAISTRVKTVANAHVAIPDAPITSDYVAMILGHSNIISSIDIVSFDIDKWYVYSNTAQTLHIRFYKIPF